MALLTVLASHWGITAIVAAIAILVILVLPSIRIIGPTEVGLVTKRFALRELPDDNPIAFRGEAGYQADLLMPGWHVKLWLIYIVEKHPWVQVRAGEIGVVVAQAGRSLPIGAKSAESVGDLSHIADLRAWLTAGGQKGVQRPVLPPGSLMPVHPVGFLVITRERVYGVPVAHEFQRLQAHGKLTCESFGLSEENLKVMVITPRSAESGGVVDTCGIVTTLGRRAAAGRRHRQPAGRVRRHQEAGKRSRDRPHADRGPDRVEIGPAQQLPGFRRLSEGRRQDGLAARSAALRGVSAESVPGPRRAGADAGGQARRGGRDQGLRRPAHRRTPRARRSSSGRSSGPATAASGKSRCGPASTPSIRAATRPNRCPRPS